jgi:hypothetical protein
MTSTLARCPGICSDSRIRPWAHVNCMAGIHIDTATSHVYPHDIPCPGMIRANRISTRHSCGCLIQTASRSNSNRERTTSVREDAIAENKT